MFPKHKIILYQLILIVVFLCFSSNFVLADQRNDQSHVLKSASEFDYPPFAIVRSDGTADGFSVELLKAVVGAADLEVNISVGPWHEIKQKLAEGRLDVLPLVAYSSERDKVFDFTAPYLQMHGTIFVRKGEKSIRSEADLKGKEVIVMRGDYAHEYMVSQNIPAKLILTTDYENAMKLLSSGKHDAIFCQYLMGLQLIKNLNIKNVVSVATKREKSLKPRAMRLAGFEQKFCFAVPEGRADLLSRLNEGLSIVHANGTYQDLYDKWFSPILPKPAVPLLTVIKSMLFTLLPIMFFVAVIGVWYLRQEVRRKTQSLRIEIKEREQAEAELKKSRDALDRRVVERTVELEKTYAQLLHAEKLSAIGKLTASIAHEFNNPLYGIKNVIEGIKRNFTLDDEYRELLDLALSECDRVRDLIKNLQDFNRPSSDVKEEVNIHVLLDEMVLMVKKDYKTAHVVIKKQYAPDLPSVHAVSDQMKQVFLNLLTNAKDAITVDGGTVTITTEKLGNRISVRISDTGSGIAENVLPHIFEPFFTTKPAIKGTGLGLSVSYGIIKGHNGDIQVDSVPGRGTTFSILLPVHEETDDATKHIAR